MFERFARDARDLVIAAQAAARADGARSIDSRYVLIGLLETEGPALAALRSVGLEPPSFAAALRQDMADGLDASALASVGIDLDAVRERADAVFGPGALDRAGRTPSKGHLPFTPEAKKALELALREAIRLHSNVIDGSMLLLGLLRSTGSPAEKALRQALTKAGSSVEALRSAVERPNAQAS